MWPSVLSPGRSVPLPMHSISRMQRSPQARNRLRPLARLIPPGLPHRSMSASTTRPVRHNIPSQLSIVARPHEDGLLRSWRADSPCLLRWAESRNDRSAEIAAELVRLKVDVIVTYSSEHTQIAKQATSTIPIVFALAADPVGSGLVANLARPGGNLTGLSAQNVDLTGKRFELLREIVPGLRRLAVLFNGNNPTATIEIDIVRTAASPLGIEVSPSAILGAEDIAPAIARIAKQADALFVVGEPLTF